MKKAKENFTSVNYVLPEVLQKLGLDKRLKEHTILQIWPEIVSDKLANNTRAIFIDSQKNLVVAVRDASVAQELSLTRYKIMQKLTPLAKSLAIEISNIRIDLKHFHQPAISENTIKEVHFPSPSQHDLDKITLGENEKKLIEELFSQLQLSTNLEKNSLSLKEKALRTYERQLKLRAWRIEQKFPICEKCLEPTARLHEINRTKLCFNCLNALP